jgi:hypothetical protein
MLYATTPNFGSPCATLNVVSMTHREYLFRLGFGMRF